MTEDCTKTMETAQITMGAGSSKSENPLQPKTTSTTSSKPRIPDSGNSRKQQTKPSLMTAAQETNVNSTSQKEAAISGSQTLPISSKSQVSSSLMPSNSTISAKGQPTPASPSVSVTSRLSATESKSVTVMPETNHKTSGTSAKSQRATESGKETHLEDRSKSKSGHNQSHKESQQEGDIKVNEDKHTQVLQEDISNNSEFSKNKSGSLQSQQLYEVKKANGNYQSENDRTRRSNFGGENSDTNTTNENVQESSNKRNESFNDETTEGLPIDSSTGSLNATPTPVVTRIDDSPMVQVPFSPPIKTEMDCESVSDDQNSVLSEANVKTHNDNSDNRNQVVQERWENKTDTRVIKGSERRQNGTVTVEESRTTKAVNKDAEAHKNDTRPGYSEDTEYQRRWYHNEFSEDLTINLVAFDLPNDTGTTREEPLAYRDSDGNIRMYKPGHEPTVLVKDYSFDEMTGRIGWDRQQQSIDADDKCNENGHQERLDYPNLDVSRVIREVTEENDDAAQKSDRGDTKSGNSSVVNAALPRYPMDTDDYAISDVTHPLEIPGPGPPMKRRIDLIPDENMFVDIDLHAIKAPGIWKENLSQLVLYLTDVAYTPLEQVRAFYMWITHNINYDTNTYFGRTKPRSMDPYAVLKSRLTICEGYARLFEALCREVGIHVVTIIGVVRGYGYRPSDDIFHEKHYAHAWNAVLLGSDWFFVDTTWGAGFVKTKERKYVARFNNVYFLTDPNVFISDHYPLRVDKSQKDVDRWQLLEKPASKGKFKAMVNMEKHGKEWYVKTVSHKKVIIQNVQNELDVILAETHVPMRDYVAFLYKGDQKLEQFTYTYKTDCKKAVIHVCMPSFGYFSLQIYGRRKSDSKDAVFQPLVKYTINCTAADTTPLPYPSHHTCYGPSEDITLFGIKHCGAVYQTAAKGEVTIPIQTSQFVDILPRLSYEDYTTVLHEYCFFNYSEDFEILNLNVRLPYKGYYKLMLFGKQNESEPHLRPFMTYLIDSRVGCSNDAFPVQLEHALRNKCCLLHPVTKILPAKNDVLIRLRSPFLQMLKCNDVLLEAVEEYFEGVIKMPTRGTDVILYGADNDEDSFHPLYNFNTA